MLLLTGDVGGTKTELALCRQKAGHLDLTERRRYASGDFESLEAVLQTYLSHVPRALSATAAGFGLAGPVHRQTCRITNLPWVVDGAALTRTLGMPVRLVNDFEAVGFALCSLAPEDTATLQAGAGDAESDAPMALLGAGTGLGCTLVLPAGGSDPRVVPGEGGHADFAPQSPLEVELLGFMRSRHGHVSWERVLSGAGLAALYDFGAQRAPGRVQTETRQRMGEIDPAAVVTERADVDPLCCEALDLFCGLYGAEAGNLALRGMTRGGVFLAGGIAPRILSRLSAPDGAFLQGFRRKGRFEGFLAGLPIRVILDAQVALRGAAVSARAALAT